MTTPSGNSLPVTYEGQAHKKIRIVPIELGLHRITLLLAGQQVNGMFHFISFFLIVFENWLFGHECNKVNTAFIS